MAFLAPEAVIEAIDGPVVVATLDGKSMPILTRLGDGKIGFRMMGKFAKHPAAVALVQVVFENGDAIKVGADQVFYKKGMTEARAADLQPGDALELSWDYPEGYRPPDLPERRPADGSLRVQSVTPAGEGEAFTAPVRDTGRFFLTAGALLKA